MIGYIVFSSIWNLFKNQIENIYKEVVYYWQYKSVFAII